MAGAVAAVVGYAAFLSPLVAYCAEAVARTTDAVLPFRPVRGAVVVALVLGAGLVGETVLAAAGRRLRSVGLWRDGRVAVGDLPERLPGGGA